MQILKIELSGYKSIKNPAKIHFMNSSPTVLIGKNGSGKTNILEGLALIAEANEYYFGGSNRDMPDYKAVIELDKADIERLFPGGKADKPCRFVAHAGENGKIDRIESEYLVPLLNAEVKRIRGKAEELKKALDVYKKQLHKIAHNGGDEPALRQFEIIDFKNSTTNYDILNFQVGFLIEQAGKLADTLLANFESKDNVFRFAPVYDYYKFDDTDKFAFQLKYVKPDLASFEKKYITIDEPAIKRQITRINKATKDSVEKITALIKELGEYTARLKEALTDETSDGNNDNTFYRFVRAVRNCIGRKCLFLRNESSDVLFKSEEREREYYRDDKSFVILQTYLNRVYKGADKEELLKQMQNDKSFSLSDDAAKDFEKYLNSSIPEFDKEMYDRISIDRSGGKIPEIRLHEKSGDVVPLGLTSAGRRWYFTYYFMKNTLAPGDVFIIDEPAGMLHPTAQKEILTELCELEKQGVKVIYSTHSPYLIPNDWRSVQFVSMGNDGTAVFTLKKETDYSAKMKEICGNDIFDLQELLEKYRKRRDKSTVAYNCAVNLIEKYGSIEAASEAVHFSYDTIESWKKKKRGMTFENLIVIAGACGVPPEKLL